MSRRRRAAPAPAGPVFDAIGIAASAQVKVSPATACAACGRRPAIQRGAVLAGAVLVLGLCPDCDRRFEADDVDMVEMVVRRARALATRRAAA